MDCSLNKHDRTTGIKEKRGLGEWNGICCLALGTKEQIPGKSYKVPGGVSRGGTHFANFWLSARASLAPVFLLCGSGKLGPRQPAGLRGGRNLDSPDLNLSMITHWLGELGQVTIFLILDFLIC